jgi:SAM-dependent methyltransferase
LHVHWSRAPHRRTEPALDCTHSRMPQHSCSGIWRFPHMTRVQVGGVGRFDRGSKVMVDRDPKAYYQGATAENYERRRSRKALWQREQSLVTELLHDIGVGPGSLVLDATVGTGRFFHLYRSLGCSIVGLDISSDMLRLADESAREVGLDDVSLRKGDITAIDLPDKSVDIVVCVRFANLVDLSTFTAALAEFARVSREIIIVSVPVWTPLLGAGLREGAVRLVARVKHRLALVARGHRKRTRRHRESAVRVEFARLGLMVAQEDVLEQSRLRTHWMFTVVLQPQGYASA